MVIENKISNNMDTNVAEIWIEISEWNLSFQNSLETLKKENSKLKEKCHSLKATIYDCEQLDELKRQMRDISNMEGWITSRSAECLRLKMKMSMILEKSPPIHVPWNRSGISMALRLYSIQKYCTLNNLAAGLQVPLGWQLPKASAILMRLTLRCVVHLSTTFKSVPIPINAHLTVFTKLILIETKKIVRTNQLAYTWVKEGRMLVKVMKDEIAWLIFDNADLVMLV